MADKYLTVHVTPRARREAVAVEGDTIRVRVSAPPDGGAANRAALALLGVALGVRRSELRIVAGSAGRRKLIAVDGMDAEEALVRLRQGARDASQQ